MNLLDVFYKNSREIILFFLKRTLITGLGHCLSVPRTARDILNCLLPFSLTTFKNAKSLCLKQYYESRRAFWVYEPKLKLILDLLKDFDLVTQKGDLFSLRRKKIILSSSKNLIQLSQYYSSFWRFCITLTSRLWIIKLFEYPCTVSSELLAYLYKSLFFKEQISKALDIIFTNMNHGNSTKSKLYFYPLFTSEFYHRVLNLSISSTPDEADVVIVNNFLNVYSLLELRSILKNKKFVLIQPTKGVPMGAISVLYSLKSLPENIMLNVNESPTPITFVRYS